jgi:hypothetical protein
LAAAVTRSGLANNLLAAVGTRLLPLGFRKRAGGIFTMELAGDVLGWLGLNRAFRAGEGRYEVNAVVGVRHQQVERVVAEFLDERPHPYRPPTISVALGYLMPDRRYEPWLFGQQGLESTSDELATAIATYGLPFMQRNGALEAVARGLEQGLGHYGEYQLPVALALLGEIERATQMLASSVDRLGDRDDERAKELRAFARTFAGRWPGRAN